MKWNWGTGILAFIILFVAGVVSFFIYAMNLDYHLVEHDYYPKELEYGKRIDQIQNTYSLEEKITLEAGIDFIQFRYPEITRGASLTGKIHLYRPSDEKLDMKFPAVPDSTGVQYLPVNSLAPGKYIIKIEWSFNGKDYYQEEVYVK